MILDGEEGKDQIKIPYGKRAPKKRKHHEITDYGDTKDDPSVMEK